MERPEKPVMATKIVKKLAVDVIRSQNFFIILLHMEETGLEFSEFTISKNERLMI
jgi:hypothetical protein